MAEAAVVTVSMGVMKSVLAKLATLMGDEYQKIKGLRKEVAFLQRELGDMDALLEKMDSADELDAQAKKWRRDIIEMSYNIEDRIDDFMQTAGEADENMGILQYLRTIKDRRRLANQFQEIKTQVVEASERRKRYMLDQCISVTAPVIVDPRMSTLYKESASLVGIDAEKDELVNWAMDKGKGFKIMAIVGPGGLGKTTLANEVYREVGGRFDCKAFVSVSQKPQMIGLFNSLLSQLGLRTYSHACQLQDPINDIRGHLQDKRYFIVVDDLWDIQSWKNTICCAFPQNVQHSKVVITTRIEDVARACCGNYGFIHTMKPLSEVDSRKLFIDRIFGSEDDCPSQFTELSCKILKKCGGLPLAIIAMASMLACQPTRLEVHWKYIQNSLDTNSATNSNHEDMMYILDLSYKNLPRHLKACFLYLGSYPEDHEISRVDLVRRWVAEGFVSNSAGPDAWDVAESYFNELINRSMIQPTYMEYVIGVHGCRLHDMLLDLIVRRCRKDNFLSLVNDTEPAPKGQEEVIRRLTVVGLRGNIGNDINLTITNGRNLSQIRSLTILGESNWIPPLLEFKFIRVLVLQSSWPGIRMDLTSIIQLSQLRYLKVVGKVVLPRKIRGLRLLETLDLFGISSCSIPPQEIVDVPHLSHLIMPWRMRLPDRIIGEAKSLRTLCDFTLSINLLEGILGLGELTALSNLGLHFPEGSAHLTKKTWMAALRTSLEKLSHLRQLDLYYTEVAWFADELSLLSLPFHNLGHLYMRGCTFSRVPKWIGHLQNLRMLWIGVKQMLQEDVVIIGTGAPSLLRFSLWIAGALTERIKISGSTGFPVLKYFWFDCDGVSYLSFEARAMPKLRELELVFHADEWDNAAPGGLQHLRSLEKITAQRACYLPGSKRWRPCNNASKDEKKARDDLVWGVFQKVADALPTRPAFTLGPRCFRPTEEEEDH